MPNLIVDGRGTQVGVEEIAELWNEFKQEKIASRLEYRNQEQSRIPMSAMCYYFMRSFAQKAGKAPRRGTHEYDLYIDNIWKEEPILAGTVYGMQAKSQTKQWKITGGRNAANRSARMLNDSLYSYWKHGWWGFAGVSALDFYTTRVGTMWGAMRRGNDQYGQLDALEHLDSLSCHLTGSREEPVRYESAETGQSLTYREGEIINFTSMTLSRETELGAGFCAVERAMRAAQVLVMLNEYDIGKMSNLPPEGIASISGLTQNEIQDALQTWITQRQADNSLIYPQVLWLASGQPNANVDVALTAFSSLPENFQRDVVINMYVNILANAFGVSASDIWFMGGGPFGTGREVEMQHTYAKGKGEGEWFAASEQIINRELPAGVEFHYDTDSIEEDLTSAQTAKAWVDALLPLVERGQELEIGADQWKTLFVEKGIIPTWMHETTNPDQRTTITSSQVMLKEDADDLVTFMWSMGQVREVPRPIVVKAKAKQSQPVHTGIMIAAFVPTQQAVEIIRTLPSDRRWEKPEDLHLTLAYMGDVNSTPREGQDIVVRILNVLAYETVPFRFTIGGTGVFAHSETDGTHAFYASVDSPDLPSFRQKLIERLEDVGVSLPSLHGFTPHITLGYLQEGENPPSVNIPTVDFLLSVITLAWGDLRSNFLLTGTGETKEDELPPIKGAPISESEVETGTHITRKTIESEQDIWLNIPELRAFVPEKK